MSVIKSWSLEREDGPAIFPHSNEGNEVRYEPDCDRITIWCDLSDDEECYPALTIEQAKILRWALGKAIKDAEEHKRGAE